MAAKRLRKAEQTGLRRSVMLVVLKPKCGMMRAICHLPCSSATFSSSRSRQSTFLRHLKARKVWCRASPIMSHRFFNNDLPDYDASTAPACRFPSSHDLLTAALNLKNEIIEATWSRKHGISHDHTLYTGVEGTAFLCFKSFERTGSDKDLLKCLEIVKSGSPDVTKHMKAYVTFLCGRAGNYALGAVAEKYSGDTLKMSNYLKLLKEMAKERSLVDNSGTPDELLYGRAGFLWACLFVNKHLGDETIPWNLLRPIVQAIFASGRAGGRCHARCPLMYEWHGTKYWGAAHGLAGIMHVLMHFPLSKEDADDVKGTLHYMIANRFPSGNYPSAEGDTDDSLVHWCHGAPGVLVTLCKAAEVFPSEAIFKEAAIDAGEVVWRRGLLRRLGICHGISGNTYAFLALYRLTGDPQHLHRARAFSMFLYEHAGNLIASGKMHGGDRPFSLFEGWAGLACLWFAMTKPEDSRFPAHEL